ncbi:hypothetical protein EIP86_000895 [Pleurotus ostreatoroseus]|nr:hypothetical protein EIP86_000895 [Pleurotus ostreatoroseus]
MSKTYPPVALQAALASSLTTGVFPDTAYHLYSRRLSENRIGVPRVVYANSTVLKAAGEHFVARKLLPCTISQELTGGFDSDGHLECETDCYDYAEDSDLEDFEDPPMDTCEGNDGISVGDGKDEVRDTML